MRLSHLETLKKRIFFCRIDDSNYNVCFDRVKKNTSRKPFMLEQKKNTVLESMVHS